MVSLDYLVQFVREDAPFGDATSDAVIPEVSCHAIIRAEQAGIIAGIEEAAMLFTHFGVQVKACVTDGDRVNRGDTLLSLSGTAKKILLVERTALNILGRMSGIATQTKKMVDIVNAVDTRCRVAGTRKTSPGFRALDKKAIILGGGDPHRYSLSDGILIKDNHLSLVSLPEAIHSARKTTTYKKVEVEVETVTDALVAAKAGADIIMLDNMSTEQIQKTITALKHECLRDKIEIELSGGIDEETIKRYAALGADVISLGALTHSVRNFSVNLAINP